MGNLSGDQVPIKKLISTEVEHGSVKFVYWHQIGRDCKYSTQPSTSEALYIGVNLHTIPDISDWLTLWRWCVEGLQQSVVPY
jgi:hypothetical protein